MVGGRRKGWGLCALALFLVAQLSSAEDEGVRSLEGEEAGWFSSNKGLREKGSGVNEVFNLGAGHKDIGFRGRQRKVVEKALQASAKAGMKPEFANAVKQSKEANPTKKYNQRDAKPFLTKATDAMVSKLMPKNMKAMKKLAKKRSRVHPLHAPSASRLKTKSDALKAAVHEMKHYSRDPTYMTNLVKAPPLRKKKKVVVKKLVVKQKKILKKIKQMVKKKVQKKKRKVWSIDFGIHHVEVDKKKMSVLTKPGDFRPTNVKVKKKKKSKKSKAQKKFPAPPKTSRKKAKKKAIKVKKKKARKMAKKMKKSVKKLIRRTKKAEKKKKKKKAKKKKVYKVGPAYPLEVKWHSNNERANTNVGFHLSKAHDWQTAAKKPFHVAPKKNQDHKNPRRYVKVLPEYNNGEQDAGWTHRTDVP